MSFATVCQKIAGHLSRQQDRSPVKKAFALRHATVSKKHWCIIHLALRLLDLRCYNCNVRAHLNGSLQVVIVHRWQLHSREQVAQDAIEQRHILVQELGQVDIIDGSQHEHILA